MSTHINCDGCGVELGPFRAEPRREKRLIHGQRGEHSGKGLHPIPDEDFDWCEDCAKIAFTAVRMARGLACRFCGSAQRLEITHIDGDVANNDPGNLDVRCTRCRWRRTA